MNHLRSLLGCLALVVAFVVPTLVEASVRKCNRTPNGLWAVSGEPILVLDGQIVGRLAPVGGVRQPGQVYVNDLVPVQENILRIDVVCLEVSEEDRIVGRQALAVVTKSGAVEFMRLHLQALFASQEEHRTSKGTYAADLLELDFFASRAPLPIQLAVQQDAWFAQVTLEGLNTVCLVEGGKQKEVPTDQLPSVVRCEAA